MIRIAWILLPLGLAVGCAMRADAPAPPAPPSAAGNDDSDCNLQTPLRPGVPGSPGNLIASTRNPNGDSELAVLMRQFVDDLREARPHLERGEPVRKLAETHRKMRCAWHTTPEGRNERFDALSVVYLHAVRTYDAAPGKDAYNSILASCVACHSTSCRGPLDLIEGMIWR